MNKKKIKDMYYAIRALRDSKRTTEQKLLKDIVSKQINKSYE